MIGFLEEATLQMDLKQGSDVVLSTGKAAQRKMVVFKLFTWT
jgi:hypothetical protein